jgi:hypothetical protein
MRQAGELRQPPLVRSGKLSASDPDIDAISSNYRPLLLSLFLQETADGRRAHGSSTIDDAKAWGGRAPYLRIVSCRHEHVTCGAGEHAGNRLWQWTALQRSLQRLHGLVQSGHGEVSSVAASSITAPNADCGSAQETRPDGPSCVRDTPIGLDFIRATSPAERCGAAIRGNAACAGRTIGAGPPEHRAVFASRWDRDRKTR